MDETPNKPSQIRVGAGLEESRLNQDFVDFLKKWSTPILLVAALVALGFVALQKYRQHKRDTVDMAFRELEAVSSTDMPSPDSLAEVARTYQGIEAVPAIAHNRAGDSLMFSIQTGLKAGAKVKPDGTLEQESDVLTDSDRASILSQAERHYQTGLDLSMPIVAQRPISFGSLFGLASVAESRGEADKAKGYYERIIALVDADAPTVKEDGTTGERPFASHSALAKERIAHLSELGRTVSLISETQLPKLPPLPGQAPQLGNLPAGVTVTPVDAPDFAKPAPSATTPPPAPPSQPPAAPAPTEPSTPK